MSQEISSNQEFSVSSGITRIRYSFIFHFLCHKLPLPFHWMPVHCLDGRCKESRQVHHHVDNRHSTDRFDHLQEHFQFFFVCIYVMDVVIPFITNAAISFSLIKTLFVHGNRFLAAVQSYALPTLWVPTTYQIVIGLNC